jgi:MFS family permease
VLDSSFAVRVVVVLIVLLPLGVALGMFMPLGLAQVHRISPGEMHAAWAWAVNGFLSVIGSVLATILAMSFGFKTVQWLALAIYGVAVVAFIKLSRHPGTAVIDLREESSLDALTAQAPVTATL